ncbi:MAG TPA: (2Fe-2S)-binding protein [Candidatus Acidoferrum sp.]|jgi:carbon-monoxide dehydrogenase small subunit|nr:(2Fe-2S)-binding protein [Candidatus Acidoferrum sp.]
MKVSMRVNGAERSGDIEPRVLLVDFIRTNLGLTGTHIGCDTSSCGACTVLVDGDPVKSCTVLAVQAEGRAVKTIEGIAGTGALAPIQVGFHEEHGLQCGFCTPGMMLLGEELISRIPNPTDEQIRWAISGNICRCTGYMNIVKAVQHAAKLTADASKAPAAAMAGGAE